MNSASQESGPTESNARGIVVGEAHPGGKTKQRRRRTEPDLEIADNILGDEVIRGLLDEWLVPAIVDSLIRDLPRCAVDEPR